jgi:hypothetical protein
MKTLAISMLVGFGVMGCVSEGEELGEGGQGGDELEAPPALDDLLSEKGGFPGASILGSTATEAPLPQRGGYGGTYSGHVTPAAVIYAVRVRAGDKIDNIAFGWYQPRRADNLFQTGDGYGQTGFYGGGGGTDRGWWYCPSGQGVIGIRGSAGDVLDRVGVICGDVNNPDPYNPFNTYSPLWGGGGGSWFEDKCGAGRLVDSFNVRAATLVDMVQPICVNAH